MTTAIIEQYYAAFNAGDWDAMLACLTDDVAHDLNQGGREVGKDAFRAFLARMNRSYRERLEDIVVLAAPGRTASTWSPTTACRRPGASATSCPAARSSRCATAGSPASPTSTT